MTTNRQNADFPEQADENRRIWDANALSTLFRFGFEAGFVVDGIEEPHFPGDTPKAGVHWHDMPDIPPVMVVRMKLMRGNQPLSAGDWHAPRDVGR
jgi:hypothetical protein